MPTTITVVLPDVFEISIAATRTLTDAAKTEQPHPIFGKGGSTKAGSMQVTALNLGALSNDIHVEVFTKLLQQKLGVTTDKFWVWRDLDGSPKTIDAMKVFATAERKTAMTKVINIVIDNKMATPDEITRLKGMSIPEISTITDGDGIEYAKALALALYYAGLVDKTSTMTRIKKLGDQYARIALQFNEIKL